MGNVLIEERTLTAIGDAIRAKTGKTALILPSDMPAEIAEITGGGGGSREVLVEVLKKKTYSGFTQAQTQDYYQLELESDVDFESELNLIAGEEYVVFWDGVEHRLTASQDMDNFITLALGEFSEGDFPFTIGYTYDYSDEGYDVLRVSVKDDRASHLFGIYKVTNGVSYKSVVFGKQDVEGFAFDSGYGVHKAAKNPAWFQLEVDETYIVNWEGTEYICVGQHIDMGSYTSVCIGNCSPLGGIGNDEPFIVAYVEAYDVNTFFALTTESKHNVAVYKECEVDVPHELVKYVSFMSWDGTTELYRKPTITGDDCVDVLDKGFIETPTRESTNYADYTHSGWSLTSGGSANSGALKNITEDRVVYAAFKENVKYYTVNFYIDVGVLHETVKVTYGGTANPVLAPEKSGYIFKSWSPSNENITADTDCYAVWMEGLSFARSPWADIARACEAGEASLYFKVGETRDMVWTNKVGNTITTQLQIVGIDHDDLADGSGKAGLSIMIVPILALENWFYYNGTNPVLPYKYVNVSGGWGTCKARAIIKEQFEPLLPSDLKSHIKEVTKISTTSTFVNMQTTNYGIETTSDKLWIPSITEMNGINNSYSKKAEGAKYEFFADNTSRIKYLQNSDGTIDDTAVKYALRSLSGYGNQKNTNILETGSHTWNGNIASYRFAFGFCI